MYVFHVKPHQWWTRYWQLHRKLGGYSLRPSGTDCRLAAILLQQATRCGVMQSSDGCLATDYLEEMVRYGKDDFEARLAAAKASQGLGT